MLVIGSPSGMLANRLWRLAHFVALSVSHDIRVIDPWFSEYEQYFEIKKSFPASVTLGGSLSRGFTSANLKLVRGPWVSGPFHCNHFATAEIDMDAPGFVRNALQKVCVCYGYSFRARQSFQVAATEVRRAFCPKGAIRDQVEKKILNIRQRFPGKVVVGVHVRKGDYAHWRAGAYLFSDERYSHWCQMIQEELRIAGQSALFVIFSNTVVQSDPFRGLDTVVSSGNEIEDLYCLAKCDFVIGPPSTYTMWASFYGGKPLFHCHKSTDMPHLSDFRVLVDDYVLPPLS